MNDDIQTITSFMKTISKSKRSKISVVFVNENNWPRYPKKCDIINTWGFSSKTPRCSKNVYQLFMDFV